MYIRHDRESRIGNGRETMRDDILEELENFSEILNALTNKLKDMKAKEESALERQDMDDLDYLRRMLNYGIVGNCASVDEECIQEESESNPFGKSIRLANREESLHPETPALMNGTLAEGFQHPCRNKVLREEEMIPHHAGGKVAQWAKYILDLADTPKHSGNWHEKKYAYNRRLHGSFPVESMFNQCSPIADDWDDRKAKMVMMTKIMQDIGIPDGMAEDHPTRLDPYFFKSICPKYKHEVENNIQKRS